MSRAPDSAHGSKFGSQTGCIYQGLDTACSDFASERYQGYCHRRCAQTSTYPLAYLTKPVDYRNEAAPANATYRSSYSLRQSRSASSQAGIRKPNTSASLSTAILELAGRFAGVG